MASASAGCSPACNRDARSRICSAAESPSPIGCWLNDASSPARPVRLARAAGSSASVSSWRVSPKASRALSMFSARPSSSRSASSRSVTSSGTSSASSSMRSASSAIAAWAALRSARATSAGDGVKTRANRATTETTESTSTRRSGTRVATPRASRASAHAEAWEIWRRARGSGSGSAASSSAVVTWSNPPSRRSTAMAALWMLGRRKIDHTTAANNATPTRPRATGSAHSRTHWRATAARAAPTAAATPIHPARRRVRPAASRRRRAAETMRRIDSGAIGPPQRTYPRRWSRHPPGGTHQSHEDDQHVDTHREHPHRGPSQRKSAGHVGT